MDYNSQDPEEYKRQMALRRRNNTIMLAIIGVIIVALVALSGNQYAVFALVGILIVVIVLVLIRGWLERRYHRRKAEEKVEGDENSHE